MLCVVINVHIILVFSYLYRISDAQVVRVEREVKQMNKGRVCTQCQCVHT